MNLAGLPELASFLMAAGAGWDGWSNSAHFGERTRDLSLSRGVRVHLNAAGADRFDSGRPTRLILYALPNGNTIEQTVGCRKAPGLDWHFDIQHIGAQTRALRESEPSRNTVVAYLEAPGLSWPAWRRDHAGDGSVYGAVVRDVLARVPAEHPRITLIGHSGGGSFAFGLIGEREVIPSGIDRIAFLDSNYSYDDATHRHGDKLLGWLRAAPEHRLVVLAYDDRNVRFKGKRVVGPTGGTFRATERMLARLRLEASIEHSGRGDFDEHRALDDRARFYVHRNPENRILHTALVGDMNGFLYAMTVGTPHEEWRGTLGRPRAYTRWIQPEPQGRSGPPGLSIPPRPGRATGGRAFMVSVAGLDLVDREAAILRELSSGNLPGFLRDLKPVGVTAVDRNGAAHRAEYAVTPDYLAVGSDDDFVRVPMTPQTAQKLADLFGGCLPTRKMVDDIDAHAQVKLAPRPMTEAREAVATFVAHHELIEAQRTGHVLGELVCGIKKDVVLSNRISERPRRLALYGWRKLDGTPIQPLTTVHCDTYVDYSHGVRLASRRITVDGVVRAADEVLRDEKLCVVLSDEGAIHCRYSTQ